MKMFPTSLSSTALILIATANFSVGAQAAGENIGDTQQCIQLSRIDNSPAIDSRTILIEMEGSGGYKRIDLASSCPGLVFNGFSISTSIDKLCTSDTLTVPDNGGAVCLIDKIVTIDEAEAKALRAK